MLSLTKASSLRRFSNILGTREYQKDIEYRRRCLERYGLGDEGKTETKAEGRTKGRKEAKPLAKDIPVTISQTATGMSICLSFLSASITQPERTGSVISIRSKALRCTESGQRRSCCHCKLIHTVCIRSTISCTDQFVPRTYRMGDENQVLWCKEMKVGAIERHERVIDAGNGARRVPNGHGKEMLTISLPRAMYGQFSMKCCRKKQIPDSQVIRHYLAPEPRKNEVIVRDNERSGDASFLDHTRHDLRHPSSVLLISLLVACLETGFPEDDLPKLYAGRKLVGLTVSFAEHSSRVLRLLQYTAATALATALSHGNYSPPSRSKPTMALYER
jgi:hypothetical protein